MSGVSILMYHALESEEQPSGARNAGEQRYVLHEDRFREQMEFLHREGFKTVLFEELFSLDEWPDRAVVLTFDDGHESNFRAALPILLHCGFRAEFFITTGFIGTPHFMTKETIKSLGDAGMGIGSHGVSHKYLDDMNAHEIRSELRNSMERLQDITGRKIISFSAPGGRLPRYARGVAEDLGYRIMCTSRPGVLKRSHPLHNVPRLAVRSNTDIKAYKMMVRGDHPYINGLLWRNNCLFLAKKLLGNRVYECVWHLMLPSR